MNEKEITKLLQALLHELNNPERQLSTIVQDFEECGIDYCVIGSLAVRCHNYVRCGADTDVLVSEETCSMIARWPSSLLHSRPGPLFSKLRRTF